MTPQTLPYDVARCPGVGEPGAWREGCEDCLRRTVPGRAKWQPMMQPPPIIAFECEMRIPPTGHP